MRDPAVIQMDAWQRARDERDQRKRQGLDDRRIALAEARLQRFEDLFRAYRLTRETQ